MTIGIDIRVLGNKIKSGIEEYTENLLPNLIEEGKDISFKLFYSSHRNTLPDYDWLNKPNVKLYKFKYPNNLLFLSSQVLNRPFLDKQVEEADVFFFPHFFLSSLSPSCKRVTTFHDLSYLHYPEFITLRKTIWHNLQMKPKWQAKFSDKIIVVSESTKRDLVNFYKIDPTRIEVIYSGVKAVNEGALLGRRAPSCSSIEFANFKRAKNLPNRFILFLGKLEPRKNIVSIIKAFNNFKINPKYKDVGLVIAGAKGWLCEEIFKEADMSDYKRQIIFTGHLNNDEKFLYYHAADIFVYPSFFEGFGFPPLEAMSCGTPVITSRNSSLSEVVGNSGVIIDPYDVVELQLWITQLLEDKKLYGLIAKKEIEQSLKFNWRNTATKTLEVLSKT